MTVSFKKFATFLSQAEGERSPYHLDELWSRIIDKKKEEEDEKEKDTRGKVLTAKERLEKKKEDDEARKSDLRKKRDEEWAKAKERVERPASNARSGRGSERRGEVDWHRAFNEGKQTYTDAEEWKNDAKAAGFKVKKLAGNEEGDQTWGAFKDDEKVGVFSEQESGWLLTE